MSISRAACRGARATTHRKNNHTRPRIFSVLVRRVGLTYQMSPARRALAKSWKRLDGVDLIRDPRACHPACADEPRNMQLLSGRVPSTILRSLVVDEKHSSRISAIRTSDFFSIEEAPGIFGSIQNDQSRRPIRFDNVNTVNLDAVEVHGLAGAVNGSREVDAGCDEKDNGDGRGVDDQKFGMLKDTLDHMDLPSKLFCLAPAYTDWCGQQVFLRRSGWIPDSSACICTSRVVHWFAS